MQRSNARKLLFSLLSVSMLSLAALSSAYGEVVNTENAIRLSDRAATIDRINSALARQQVSQQLVALGVDPADAQQRVAALSDSELQLLDRKLANLPAGASGGLEVLGIVLLVLLVLELLGVTDVFKSI
jgi:hypothetical protein